MLVVKINDDFFYFVSMSFFNIFFFHQDHPSIKMNAKVFTTLLKIGAPTTTTTKIRIGYVLKATDTARSGITSSDPAVMPTYLQSTKLC